MPAGYLGSALIGALLIFCGFNNTAAKIAAAVVLVMLVLVLIWALLGRSWFGVAITLLFIGLIVLAYFIKHGVALRYFVLFMG